MNSGFHIVQYIGFVCAQLTNILLLSLIHKKAKKLFGSYRHVMFVFTAYSMLYAWIEMLALPISHITGPMIVIMCDSFLKYERFIGFHVLCLYCASYALCISFLATQFYYRYTVVCKPDHLGWLNGWRLWMIFLPGICLFFIWYSFVYFGMSSTPEKIALSKKAIMEFYKEDTSKVAFIALQFWDKNKDGSRSFRIHDAICYFGCLGIIATCFSTIMFCAINIYLKLKCQQTVMSVKTRELNNQLLKTLVFQTALPFFMMYSTVGTILTLPFFEIEVGYYGNIVQSTACLYPAIEPVIAMVIVKDFRNALTCHTKVGSNSEVNHIEMSTMRRTSQQTPTTTVVINKSLI